MCVTGVWYWWGCVFQKPLVPRHGKVVSSGIIVLINCMFHLLFTLHTCHNHHNRWLCKKIQSSVKFFNGYVKETDIAQNVRFYKKCVILHTF